MNNATVLVEDNQGDEFLATANADVVEWPRLSQQVRLEREAATHSWSVYDYRGKERGIFYAFEAAERFCLRHSEMQIFCKKPILRQY